MQELTRNIPWEFTDKLVTPWGGMRLMKEFLDRIKIRDNGPRPKNCRKQP